MSRRVFLLVVLGNASPAAPAMLATQRLSNHAKNTEVFLVESPRLKKLSNHRSLLVPTAKFGHITGVLDHRVYKEEGRQSEKKRKRHVQDWIGGICFYTLIVSLWSRLKAEERSSYTYLVVHKERI